MIFFFNSRLTCPRLLHFPLLMPYIIYADIEPFIQKFLNNKNRWAYSLQIQKTSILYLYCGKDCTKISCTSFRAHTTILKRKKCWLINFHIKNWVYNYYFDNLNKVKKLKLKRFLSMTETLVTYFTRYIHMKEKNIWRLMIIC